MPSIVVLPPDVADQIAAGEVVERPASVVKELVENSLDAGALAIDVAVRDGGRTLVRVSDDGCGMDREDALRALARHGTSKIRTAADLTGVRTYGFRGEAIPAIASVARLDIETAPADGTGTRVCTRGGAAPEVTGVARRRGTTVTVTDLFHNVPARLKFLRGARSEWRAVSDALTTIALARCDVRLHATHDERVAMSVAATRSLRERVAALWGIEYADALLDVDDVAGPVRVAGLVERPAAVGTSTRRVYLTVNGRPVRDAGVVRAAELAYRSTIPAGTRPSLVLALTLPPADVDVNVHPAKAEVRFHDRWSVERAVERAVRRALGTMFAGPDLGRAYRAPALHLAPADHTVTATALGATPLLPAPLFEVGEHGGDEAPVSDEPEPMPPLYQLRRTYIALEHDDGLVLVDQHSAHERVLFERFSRVPESGSADSQTLLIPLTIRVSAAEGEAFELYRDALGRVGYSVEAFGGDTLLVQAVPIIHARLDAGRALRETLAALAGDRVAATAVRHERFLATIACRAAIKAGDPLAQPEMAALIRDLRGTTLPAHDVHGRATIVRIPWSEVDRRFGRL